MNINVPRKVTAGFPPSGRGAAGSFPLPLLSQMRLFQPTNRPRGTNPQSSLVLRPRVPPHALARPSSLATATTRHRADGPPRIVAASPGPGSINPLSLADSSPSASCPRLPVGVDASPIVATSRKSLLGSEPGFQYDQRLNFGDDFHHEPFQPQPVYSQPAYGQAAYAETAGMAPANNQGYAYREGLTASVPAPSTYNSKVGFLKSKWPAAFMAVSGLQAIVCLCFEAYVFWKFQTSVSDENHDSTVSSQYKTIPTFLTLFIFGFLALLVVTWDALRMKNTIQVIGICIANLALLVYTAIQVDQIREALDILQERKALEDNLTADDIWHDVKPYLAAIPGIIAFATVLMSLIAWKLYQEFAWDILKNIGADYRMKKRFLHYQIYIALLKFDFFFFLGFIIQFVVVVAEKTDPEFALTIVTIPITIFILLAAAYFTRKENKIGQALVIVLYLGGLSYFIFKLVRIYQPGYKQFYEAVRKSLSAFAVITILLIILTIVNAVVCMRNFGSGLKAHLISPSRKDEEKPDPNSIHLQDVKPQIPSRMTID